MKIGDVVEVSHNDAYQFGVVAGEVGTDKLTILLESGVEVRVFRDDISYFLSGSVDEVDPEKVITTLAELRAQATPFSAQIDLKLLWELAMEAGGLVDLDDLCELMLSQVDDPARVALLLELADDALYFKRHKRQWEARSADGVAEQVQIVAKGEAIRASRDRFIELVCRALAGHSPADAVAKQICDDSILKTYLDALIGLVVMKEFEQAEYAEQLLQDLETATGGRLPGEGDIKAFNVLVALGIWHEHQNLPMLRYGILETETAEVIEFAEDLVYGGPMNLGDREDYTGWFTLAVDDASTKDVDDALSIRPKIEGGWQVAIHISDPSFLIEPNGLLDKAARARGTSVYPPTGTIPMFPRVLSEGGMSLLERVERPAITLVAEFDDELKLVGSEFVPSRVTVNRRLSYVEADQMLESDSLDHVTQLLGDLKYIADELALGRTESGAVVIDMPEPKVKVTFVNGKPSLQYEIIGESASRALIQEMMVLYNNLAAHWFEEREVPGIFRIQDGPEARAIRFLGRTPPGLPREFARLKSMKKAEVSTHPGRHHGLGIDAYIQMTSPIRRYNDLVMQRQMTAVCRGEKPPYTLDELLEITAHVERCSFEATLINRESDRYWILYALSEHVGRSLEAVVLDFRDQERRRATVMLVEFGYRAVARLRHPAELGDRVQLTVERAEPRRDILTFHQD